MRPVIIFAGLTLAAALPVAAHTFGLVPGSAPAGLPHDRQHDLSPRRRRRRCGRAHRSVRRRTRLAHQARRDTRGSRFCARRRRCGAELPHGNERQGCEHCGGNSRRSHRAPGRWGRSRRLSPLCALALDHARDGSSAICRGTSAATKTGWRPPRSIELIGPR